MATYIAYTCSNSDPLCGDKDCLNNSRHHWNSIYVSYRVVLPLGQSYVLASYFSIWKKFLRSLIENAIFYITFLIIFAILFVYLVVVKELVAL